jgi:hypothetical protein
VVDGRDGPRTKACVLTLVFAGNVEVTVLQSARYVCGNDLGRLVQECESDAAFFRSHGFEVLREKIEASAYGAEGIPQDGPRPDHGYFEFHIKVDGGLAEARAVAKAAGETHERPVPLSWNCRPDKHPGDGLGGQVFLNVRFRDKGLCEIKPLLHDTCEKLTDAGLRVLKIISEFVWYDTLPEMDRGWIDPVEL